MINKTLGVFAVTPAQNLEGGKPSGPNAPEAINISPVESILPNGKIVGISPLLEKYALRQFSKIDWSTAVVGPSGGGQMLQGVTGQAVSGQTVPKTPAGGVPVSEGGKAKPAMASIAPSGPGETAEEQGFKGRWKPAVGFVSASNTVVNWTDAISHDQVVHAATFTGFVGAHQANTLADTTMNMVHSHGGHVVLVAVRIGGIAGAIAVLLGYKKQALAVTVITAIIALILLSVFGREKSPFIGKWNMNAIETNYQSGVPPRQAMEEISEDKDGLKITSTAIEEGGKRDYSTVQIHPDGKPHEAGQGELLNASQKGHTLELERSRNGQVIEAEVRTLSPDEKKMTVTTSKRDGNGQSYKNVAVYDRE
jgi:hypothetical protein